ncbi:hypothetical protein NCS57_00614800 [Fusarium keratoplasticum]|uniref:Uncharacterized protein n=1 Tax=Fusarium keratoplasticum TaxID=1328300 RepID=A0ACC0R261_9HYPO|nr:hypothetical protein NCS57_00614800 [Fusarium keratoplasticum]KAI8671397.1 hypothetical protein NCS57_00614800 [Fusarium keratoplasticum]KAI8678626.1 hypothetical protein NCS55_00584100 [Fusarium keratoplasticum]
MRRSISLALGSLALLSTVAIMGVLIVLTLHIPGESSGRTLSQVSVVLEAIVLVALGWFLSSYASASFRYWSIKCLGVDYGACLLAILFATVATVATLIQLSKSTLDKSEKLLGANKESFLVGLSVALGIGFALQTGFLSVHFYLVRHSDQKALSLHTLEEDRQSAAFRAKSSVKSLRYSQTPDPDPAPRMMNSMDSRTPPPSIGGRSRAGTITSIKVQLSNAIRPVTSKTQLITTETRRPLSVESHVHRSSEDAFDTWDTSSVDTQNRQVVMEATTPPPQTKGHFLETIPGSPTASRTPSPNHEMPFEPPRIRTRSRSYSPVPSRREPTLSPQPSMSELHIHPLFRSDSPTPPPIATPGTVVVASPNAGQVITHRQSLRSLNQMRAVSNPVVPSPLSHRDSMDSRRLRDEQASIREETEAEASSQTSSERPITPPIPEWVLGAGSRSSWTGYNSRKVRSDSDSEGEAKNGKKN